MPEEIENEQTEVESTEVEEADTGREGDSEESVETAQEAEKPKPEEPFDRKRAEAKIAKVNSEAANLRKRLRELEPKAAELQAIKDADKSETERLTDKLAAAEERIAATRQQLAKSTVQALSASAFADPEDAVGALDLDSYIDADGDIDEAAIEADLQALLERKPHWAKSLPQEGPRRPAPDRTQASGANKTRPLTPAEEFSGWMKSQLK
ncbi:hypothetical protein AB0M89_12920 [Streptomyces microflavus]|uniref:hypothetical protein n=1 Tax=Streptomyces microflavus TaxID=1919 RepID=UPI0034390B8B